MSSDYDIINLDGNNGGCIEPTLNFRWYVHSKTDRVLQQEWKDIDNDKREWVEVKEVLSPNYK